MAHKKPIFQLILVNVELRGAFFSVNTMTSKVINDANTEQKAIIISCKICINISFTTLNQKACQI